MAYWSKCDIFFGEMIANILNLLNKSLDEIFLTIIKAFLTQSKTSWVNN